jgi:type III restriction enzyme
VTRRVVRLVRRAEVPTCAPLALELPNVAAPPSIGAETYTLIESEAGVTRMQRIDAGDNLPPGYAPPALTAYTAASRLAAGCRVATMDMLAALRACYRDTPVPEHHLDALAEQIGKQRSAYDERVELVDVAVALVKTDGFDRVPGSQPPVYTARISLAKDRDHIYMVAGDTADAQQARHLSFHYEGYNFDSAPEREFLAWVLEVLRHEPHQVEGIWLTGGLTDAAKTDLRAEYLGDDGRWHPYTPDFVIRRRDGKHLVVEVKNDVHSPAVRTDLERLAQGAEPVSLEGRKAVALKRWEQLDPDRLRYEVLFADQQLQDEGKPRVLAFMRGSA